MRTTTSRATNTLLAMVLAVLGSLGLATTAAATPLEPTSHASPATISAPSAECGDTSGFAEVDLSSLPAQASDTVDLIQAGGPYPYPQDGTTFQNREGLLPDCEVGYYQEFTVETPGSDDRGARRIVTGSAGEYFYTSDHYESFDLVNVNG